jgi:prophage regulatory protein
MDRTGGGPAEDRIMRKPEVLSIVNVNDSTVWRWEQEDKFPKRRLYAPNCTGWLASEVQAWMRDKFSTDNTQGKGNNETAVNQASL